MALQKGIHLHIHMPKEGLPVVSKPKAKEEKPKAAHDELVMRLAARDELEPKDLEALQLDVAKFIQGNDLSTIKAFWEDAKHMLTDELKGIMVEEIKLKTKK